MEGLCDLLDGYISTKTISSMLLNVSVKQLKLITTTQTLGLLWDVVILEWNNSKRL